MLRRLNLDLQIFTKLLDRIGAKVHYTRRMAKHHHTAKQTRPVTVAPTHKRITHNRVLSLCLIVVAALLMLSWNVEFKDSAPLFVEGCAGLFKREE